MKALKSVVQKSLNSLGYELRRRNLDAFAQQRHLVGSVSSPVIFDVGANVGRVTRTYRKLFPRARIYAFEPFAQSYEQLKQSVATDDGVSTHQLAISDRTGRLPFSSNLEAATNSLLETDDRGASFWGKDRLDTAERIEVDSITLDDFCRERSVSHIDILKLDIQGAEFLALAGALGMLGSGEISLVYSEVITMPTYKGQKKLHEILQFYDSVNFELFNIYDMKQRAGQLIQVDAIFINRAFRDRQRLFERVNA